MIWTKYLVILQWRHSASFPPSPGCYEYGRLAAVTLGFGSPRRQQYALNTTSAQLWMRHLASRRDNMPQTDEKKERKRRTREAIKFIAASPEPSLNLFSSQLSSTTEPSTAPLPCNNKVDNFTCATMSCITTIYIPLRLNNVSTGLTCSISTWISFLPCLFSVQHINFNLVPSSGCIRPMSIFKPQLAHTHGPCYSPKSPGKAWPIRTASNQVSGHSYIDSANTLPNDVANICFNSQHKINMFVRHLTSIRCQTTLTGLEKWGGTYGSNNHLLFLIVLTPYYVFFLVLSRKPFLVCIRYNPSRVLENAEQSVPMLWLSTSNSQSALNHADRA